jgi:hypothetical protein
VAPYGQEGGDEQEGEAPGGGAGEGAAEGINQGTSGPGQQVVHPPELSSDDAGLAGLAPPSLASLGLGESPPLAYAGHHGLLRRSTGGV